jgi:large subunit ribosomal protein L1
MKRSKKYIEAQKLIAPNKKYSLTEALGILPKISVTSFAGSVSMQINLNLNEKQKKEVFRGSYTLPHSFGKSLRVLVIADKSEHEKAKAADFVGDTELVKEIEEGKEDFDLVITTPMMMAKIAKLSKILGPKGMMPNPKNGTITTDLEGTIAKFKKGMKNFRAENGLILGVVGKADMKIEELTENCSEFMKAVKSEIKKLGPNAVKSIYLTPTMGPKLIIDVNSIV